MKYRLLIAEFSDDCADPERALDAFREAASRIEQDHKPTLYQPLHADTRVLAKRLLARYEPEA